MKYSMFSIVLFSLLLVACNETLVSDMRINDQSLVNTSQNSDETIANIGQPRESIDQQNTLSGNNEQLYLHVIQEQQVGMKRLQASPQKKLMVTQIQSEVLPVTVQEGTPVNQPMTNMMSPQMAFESAMQTADNSERESIAPSPSPAPSSSLVRSQINEISTPMAQISEQREALEEKSIEDAVAGTLVVNEALGSEDIVAVTENSFKLATPVLQPAAIPVENSDVAAVSPTQSNKGAEKLLSGLEGRDSYDSLPEIAESATVSEVDIIAADAMNYSQNNIIVSEEPEKQTNVARSILAMSEVPSRQIADNETAEILKLNVIDGEQGLFETCEGEPVELPVKTELKGWVRISIDSENIHTVEALDVIECHADK